MLAHLGQYSPFFEDTMTTPSGHFLDAASNGSSGCSIGIAYLAEPMRLDIPREYETATVSRLEIMDATPDLVATFHHDGGTAIVGLRVGAGMGQATTRVDQSVPRTLSVNLVHSHHDRGR